jgi:hypothetical protein
MGTTPIYALRYPAATDPADVPTDMQELATDVETLVARSGGVSYGTTLPGSPVNGQEAILVDSTTSPSFVWRFRYNAGSSSAYKWEFVGGTPYVLFATAAGVLNTFPTIAGWWAPGLNLAAPRAGDYEIVATGMLDPNGLATASAALSLYNDTATVPYASASLRFATATAGNTESATCQGHITGVVATKAIGLLVVGNNNAVVKWSQGAMRVTPLRVS